MYEANRDAMMVLAEQSCLVPELRPDHGNPQVLTQAARLKMLEQGVPLDQRNHAGPARRRQRSRHGAAKRYETQLWVQDCAEGSTGAAT